MRKLLVIGAAAACLVAACSSGSSGTKADNGKSPVTLTVWSGFTDRELGVFTNALNRFRASHPNVTIKSIGGIDDDKIIKSIRGGNAPDVALSFSTDSLGSSVGLRECWGRWTTR